MLAALKVAKLAALVHITAPMFQNCAKNDATQSAGRERKSALRGWRAVVMENADTLAIPLKNHKMILRQCAFP